MRMDLFCAAIEICPRVDHIVHFVTTALLAMNAALSLKPPASISLTSTNTKFAPAQGTYRYCHRTSDEGFYKQESQSGKNKSPVLCTIEKKKQRDQIVWSIMRDKTQIAWSTYGSFSPIDLTWKYRRASITCVAKLHIVSLDVRVSSPGKKLSPKKGSGTFSPLSTGPLPISCSHPQTPQTPATGTSALIISPANGQTQQLGVSLANLDLNSNVDETAFNQQAEALKRAEERATTAERNAQAAEASAAEAEARARDAVADAAAAWAKAAVAEARVVDAEARAIAAEAEAVAAAAAKEAAQKKAQEAEQGLYAMSDKVEQLKIALGDMPEELEQARRRCQYAEELASQTAAELTTAREVRDKALTQVDTLLKRSGQSHIKRDWERLRGGINFPAGSDLRTNFTAAFLNFESFACDAIFALENLGHAEAAAADLFVLQVMVRLFNGCKDYVDKALQERRDVLRDVFGAEAPTDFTNDTVPKLFWLLHLQAKLPPLIKALGDDKINELIAAMDAGGSGLVGAVHERMLQDAREGQIDDGENALRVPQLVRLLLLFFTQAALSDPTCYLLPAPGAMVAYHAERCKEILSPGARTFGQIKEGDQVQVVLCGLAFAQASGAVETAVGVVPPMVRRLMQPPPLPVLHPHSAAAAPFSYTDP